MIGTERLRDLVSPIAAILPKYNVDEADINRAMDYGVASCAVRAYAGGLLARDAYPNQDLYIIEFGFAPDHGEVHRGSNGSYSHMGHAATRFFVPGAPPMVLDSYSNSMLEVVSPNDNHEGFIWMGLDEGYRTYLDRIGLNDVEIAPSEILKCLIRQINAN